MTTGEFIKLLQEADPSGTAHLRMSGGIPTSVEHKEGYWDGPYTYYDTDGKYVLSTAGSKVDVRQEDVFDHVSKFVRSYDSKTWEEIVDKFRFDIGNYSNPGTAKDRVDAVLAEAREAYDTLIAMEDGFKDKYEKIAIERAQAGWTFYQDMEVDNKDLTFNLHHYYTWLIYDQNGKLHGGGGSCVADTQPVSKSGKFERKISEIVHGYYEWTLKNEN